MALNYNQLKLIVRFMKFRDILPYFNKISQFSKRHSSNTPTHSLNSLIPRFLYLNCQLRANFAPNGEFNRTKREFLFLSYHFNVYIELFFIIKIWRRSLYVIVAVGVLKAFHAIVGVERRVHW